MSTMPKQYAGLVDDAAVFPPGNAALPAALTAYDERTGAPRDLVHSFVIGDRALPELLRLRRDTHTGAPLPISVVLSAGAGGVAPVLRLLDQAPEVRLVGLEVALRDLDDLPGNARRVVTATLETEVTTYVEMPAQELGNGWLAAADEIAAAELPLKFRTGGPDPESFPSPQRLASWIDAALDRETPFKCTAGLHNAVAHHDPDTGFDHHGFLNVLAATRATLDGDDAADVLALTDADALLARLPDADTLTRTRRWFTGIGSCSVTDPYTDLQTLSLLRRSPDELG